MSLPLQTQQQLQDLFTQTLQEKAPELTDTLDGSIIDGLAGTFSVGALELQQLIVDEFSKTFIDLANGPEVTGGPDDLQTLAIDHYGEAFARPGAVAAVDTVTFSRPSGSPATYGAITIPAGSIVKTKPDANGNAQRYSTNAAVTLTDGGSSDLSATVNVTAVVAGAAGNAAAGTITVIETSLSDPTITVTNTGNSTGADAQDDATYRETIRNLIEALAGATLTAIEAKAKTVTGVVTATAVESAITVIQYDPASKTTSGNYFKVVQANLYIADSTGSASAALQAAVRTALQGTRAAGVNVLVQSATGVTVNWTVSITLNPSGPNYSTFSGDLTTIINEMKSYINNLPVGTGFVRATAMAAIMAIYGPSGTNDISSMTTSVPTGDISATATQKMVAGTITAA